MKFYFLIIFFFIYAPLRSDYINLEESASIENQTFLLTFQRSGTNWAAAILQLFFNRPIEGEGYPISKNRLDLIFSNEIPIIYRTHHPEWLININQKNNNLLFILRNYRECIAKLLQDNENRFSEEIQTNGSYITQYIKDLDFYDNWTGKKLLIYYEDLIAKPQDTISMMINFFSEKPEMTISHFMDNYEYYREKVYNSYQTQHTGFPHSDGKSLIYHSKDFSKETIKLIDTYLKERYPILWKKYLKRYSML